MTLLEEGFSRVGKNTYFQSQLRILLSHGISIRIIAKEDNTYTPLCNKGFWPLTSCVNILLVNTFGTGNPPQYSYHNIH